LTGRGFLDFFFDLADTSDQVIGGLAGLLPILNLFANAILFGLQVFGAGDGLAVFEVEFQEARKVDIRVARTEGRLGFLHMVAYPLDIQHDKTASNRVHHAPHRWDWLPARESVSGMD